MTSFHIVGTIGVILENSHGLGNTLESSFGGSHSHGKEPFLKGVGHPYFSLRLYWVECVRPAPYMEGE
jgi:hypothetical protein